jgi:N-carbamoyl-D-amino-acid hydrolase
MSRIVTVAASQSGPIARTESRTDVIERLISQLRKAAEVGCDLVVFTECALTAFFPHWWIADEVELDSWFETELPSAATKPLFDEARRLKIGFHLGFAELVKDEAGTRRFNSSLLVEKDGSIVGKHRKIHLPGHDEHRPDNPFQNLEKRFFDVGDLGFQTWRAFGGVVGMCICNDRRWSETYRVLALRGAELILLGYNTPDHIPEHPDQDRLVAFHHRLCLQSGAYQNGCWVVGSAKAGVEEGVSQLGLSSIVSPGGEIVAEAKTLGDELVIHECDLDATKTSKESLFNFEANRRPEYYGPITEQAGATLPR